MNIITIPKRGGAGIYSISKLLEGKKLLIFTLKNNTENLGLFLSESLERKFLC